MRIAGLLLVISLAGGCAQGPRWTPEDEARAAAERDRISALQAERRQEAEAAERALTPAQRAHREFETARARREAELLERAVSGSPDYGAAVTRAATANVDAQAAIPAQPGERKPPMNARAREANIRAEEARLSEVIETRRRARLAADAQQRRAQQDQIAAAQCIALGQQIEASMFSRASLLNLEGAIAGASARDNCWANYQQTRR